MREVGMPKLHIRMRSMSAPHEDNARTAKIQVDEQYVTSHDCGDLNFWRESAAATEFPDG
eukprot:scaffold182037_cov44-Attheya_sp.AAC.2